MFEPLRRVLVRRPSVKACALWREYGWRAAPDPTVLLREHGRFCSLLEDAGAEIVARGPARRRSGRDLRVRSRRSSLSTARILLQPGKEGRRQEPSRVAQDLEAVGVPVVGAVEEPAVAEGGDFIRLDEGTLLAGRGYRTSAAGIDAVAQLLPGVELHVFDLPHWRGESEVMHLLSLLSPLDADLVVAYPPLLPVALAQLLDERGDRGRSGA